MGYDNKPNNTWEDYYYAQAFPEESSLQRGGNVPFHHGPESQREYGVGSIFKSVARSVMPSLKKNWKICLDYWIGNIAIVAKGQNIKTAAKKRLKENSLAFLNDIVFRMLPRKSLKGNMNKQIAISSSKPKKHKHQPGELDDTIFSKLKKKETENGQTCSQRFL